VVEVSGLGEAGRDVRLCRGLRLRLHGLGHGHEQRSFVTEVVVDRLLGDSRLSGDRVDAGLDEAVAEEDASSGVQDRPALPRPAAEAGGIDRLTTWTHESNTTRHNLD
jgi:hypothetical protein